MYNCKNLLWPCDTIQTALQNESQQEKFSEKLSENQQIKIRDSLSSKNKVLNGQKKNAYSFKQNVQQPRAKIQSNIIKATTQTHFLQPRQNQLINHRSPQLKAKSPEIRFTINPQIQLANKNSNLIHHLKGQIVQIENSSQYKNSSIIFQNPSKNSKKVPILQKRIKTVEEETQYSSIDSINNIKMKNIIFQQFRIKQKAFGLNNFQDKISFEQKNIINKNFSKLNTFQQKDKNQIQRQSSNIYSLNTLQTIITSTQICHQFSKKHLTSKSRPSLRKFFSHKQQPHESQTVSIKQSLKDLYEQTHSQQDQNYYYENESNIFYGDETEAKQNGSKRISVLNCGDKAGVEQDYQQQLRDMIDSKYIQKRLNESKNNSPFISINPSQKQVHIQQRPEQKMIGYYQTSLEHSRQSSEQNCQFKFQNIKMKRTNTIQSINSFKSQNSCVDIKFMHNLRTRRGLSRLL